MNQRAFTYGAPVEIPDARGFRAGTSQPTGAAPRLLALGDSFTFGMGVHDDETWPAQVERDLRGRTSTPFTVINAGTISYGVFQEADLLRERGLDVRPTTVVHALYWNDFMNAAAPGPGEAAPVTPEGYFVWDGLEARAGLRGRLKALASQSTLLFSLRQALATATAAHDGAGASADGRAYDRFVEKGLTPEEWQPIERFYRDLLSLGQTHDFRVLVVLLPISDLSGQPGGPGAPLPGAGAATAACARHSRRRRLHAAAAGSGGGAVFPATGSRCAPERRRLRAHRSPIGRRLPPTRDCWGRPGRRPSDPPRELRRPAQEMPRFCVGRSPGGQSG